MTGYFDRPPAVKALEQRLRLLQQANYAIASAPVGAAVTDVVTELIVAEQGRLRAQIRLLLDQARNGNAA